MQEVSGVVMYGVYGMEHVIIYGTGNRGKKLFRILAAFHVKVAYWIDSDSKKWGKELNGIKIYNPQKAVYDREFVICIAAIDAAGEMLLTLTGMGIAEERIRGFAEMIICYGSSRFDWEKKSEKKSVSDGEYRPVLLDCSNGTTLGGVEAWSLELARELRKDSRPAYIIVPRIFCEANRDLTELLAVVDTVPGEAMLFSWNNIHAVLEKLQSQLPCCVVTSCVNDVMLAACILKRKGNRQIKIVSVVHQGLEWAYWEHAQLNQYIDCYVAVSEDIRQGLIGRGIAEDKVLHMTCPVKGMDPYVRSYSGIGDPIRIGYAGRIETEQKRMDYLLLLIVELEELGTDYRIEIAGDGSYLEAITKYVDSHNLAGKIQIDGVLERGQMTSFWKAQDVCINLSDYEGRSLSVMEAMNNGAVPIVTATSGVKEDIQNGENGYIVEIGDYWSMAQIIDRLAKTKDLLEKQGNLAHKIIAEKSSMDKHIIFWKRILQENNNA